jgi:hypothetical protein
MWRLLRVVLLINISVDATFESERRSSEVALEQEAAGARDTREGLTVHTLKAKGLRGLRARKSSHQRFATAFRSADVLARQSETFKQEPNQVPLYVPKIGLANVTEPTAMPPPPPPLVPWEDMQPLDTAVGHYLISGFIEQPTATPPPTQMSLDLAFGCPSLLTWPTEVSVQAPDACVSYDDGNWNSSSDVIIKWQKSCFHTNKDTVKTESAFDELNPNPLITYSMPNGDLFGTSQEQEGFGSSMTLRDCGGALAYTIEEKKYKQEGKANEEACKKYNSCDGIIYLQYFVRDRSGQIVAQTPYLTIFQETFEVTSTTGVPIATVSRNGWDPPIPASDCATSTPRVWNIKYAGTAPGIWATATNQWPIAMMMTMLSRRDMNRRPDGFVDYGNCEIARSVAMVLLVLGLLCCLVCTPFVIFLCCSGPCHHMLYDMEQSSFPKRMGKPSKYGG